MQKIVILGGCILLAMLLVSCMGQEYSNEARAFLRNIF